MVLVVGSYVGYTGAGLGHLQRNWVVIGEGTVRRILVQEDQGGAGCQEPLL
jgi:hypothetical protein